MNHKAKRILSGIVSLCLSLALLPVAAKADTASNITINGVDIGYADGDYFTKDGTSCEDDYWSSGSCHNNGVCVDSTHEHCNCMRYWPTGVKSTCQVDLMATQCWGFARYCQWTVYGTYDEIGGSSFSDITGAVSSSNCTASNLKRLLLGCSPATHIRCNYGHSISIVSTSEDYVEIAHANTDKLCVVAHRTLTWSQFATLVKNYGGIEFSTSWNKEYISYRPAANVGTGLIFMLQNNASGEVLENGYDDQGNNTLQMAAKASGAGQLWYFARQADGNYSISSCYDGMNLTVVDASTETGAAIDIEEASSAKNQKWLLLEESDGYVLRTALSSAVMEPNGTQPQTAAFDGDDTQIWTLYIGPETMLTAPVVNVTPGDSRSTTTFNWAPSENALRYDLQIWKDGQEYDTRLSAYSGYSAKLPAGNYEVCLEVSHYYEATMGSVTSFTVAEHVHTNDVVVTPPTCTAGGYSTYTCTQCGDVSVGDHTEMTPHRYDEGTEVLAPTCTAVGQLRKVCQDCGYDILQEIEKLPHDCTTVEAKTATCTETGWLAYEVCSQCDYTTFQISPATGHSHEASVTPAGCTEAGFTTYTCAACGDTYTADPVDALGHDFTDWYQEGTVTQRTCQRANCGLVEYSSCAKNLTTGKLYSDLSVALNEASSGDTVVLLADMDATAAPLVLYPGVKLDLGSYTLVADNLIGLKGSCVTGAVVDKNGENGAKLIVPQNSIVLSPTAPDGAAAGYKIIPVWNGDHYIFSQAVISNQSFTVSEGTTNVKFLPNFSGYIKNSLFKTDGCEDNDVSIIISVSWMESGIRVTQEYFYTTSLIIDAMNNRTLFANMTGCDEKEDLVFRIAIVTDNGVEVTSQNYVYNDYL